MQFKTLENLSVQELCDLFNKAFSDYIVKIDLTPKILYEKLISEDVQLDMSVGVFSYGKPVGFILHALRKTNDSIVAYNAGTGIVPEFRGQQASNKMYDFILPKLKQAGVSKIVLEVIEENTPAIKSYKRTGFQKTVDLNCFKGKINSNQRNNDIDFKQIEFSQCHEFIPSWDWEPTWQHSTITVQQSSSYKPIGAFLNSKLVGYAVIATQKGRVAQIGVKPQFRRMGIATELLRFLSKINPNVEELFFFNVDANASSSMAFLESVGMNHFLTQHKMELYLNSIS